MTQATNLTFPTQRNDDLRAVVSVSIAHFISHIYILVLPPLFVFIKTDFGLSYTELGLALTVFMAVSATLQTPAGFLIDRGNARLILILGVLCGMAGLVGAALSQSYWLLIAMFGLLGLGNTVYHPADYVLLSRHVSPSRIGQAYSMHTFAGMLGGAITPALMLAMHGFFGWRGAFIGAAALGLVAIAALLVMGGNLPNHQPKPRADSAGTDTSWRLLVTMPILMNLLFYTMVAFTSFGFMNFSVVALVALYDTPVAAANAALSSYLVMTALGVLIGGYVATRSDRHALIAILGILAGAAAFGLISVINFGLSGLVVTAGIAGVAAGIIMPARDMLVRAVTPPGAFGKVFGFVTNGFNIGGIISPLVIGPLLDHGQPRLVFIAIALGGLGAILTLTGSTRKTVSAS